jgi:hypothetical protein
MCSKLSSHGNCGDEEEEHEKAVQNERDERVALKAIGPRGGD